MAAKKKPSKKSKKPTPRAKPAKAKPAKRKPAKRKAVKRKPPKRSAKLTKSAPAKKAGATAKSSATKKMLVKTARPSRTPVQQKRSGRPESAFPREQSGPDSAGQAGDLQGLSDVESADSESVDELIEEGNAFEAGVVSGVEEAGRRGEREVHTREVPEDDVPGEYLDEE